MRWFRRQLVILPALALALAAAGAGAAGYEAPANQRAADVLPAELAKGPQYAVRDPVVADGYMYHYTVDSDFGAFEVTGTSALRKLAREIWAIGQLRQITGSEAFLTALKDQATKPVQFARNAITKPGETLIGIPQGVGRLFSNVVTSIESAPDPSQDSRAQELLLVGSFKRDYATRYGVDPYSSNRVLQEELDKIGRAAAFGSWTAAAAMMPIGGAAGAVLTATGLSQSFNNVLKNEPSPRIRAINEGKLSQMGVPADLAKRYLDHPVFTPRQDLILVDALARIGGASGRSAFLTAVLAAQDEEEATFFVNTAQIMRGFHETRDRITGIRMFNALPVAQTRGGIAVIPFALDHGVWTANADRLSRHLKTAYRAPGFKGRFELWVEGTVSPTGRQELAARGFTVVENAHSRFEIVD
jgi:hypothetical protein